MSKPTGHVKQLTSHREGEEIQVGDRSIKVQRLTGTRVFLRWRGDWERVAVLPNPSEKSHERE